MLKEKNYIKNETKPYKTKVPETTRVLSLSALDVIDAFDAFLGGGVRHRSSASFLLSE